MNTRYFILALCIPLAFISCKKDAVTSDDALVLIPQNAATVMRVDIPSLMEKADFEAIKKTDMYRKSVEDAREESPAFAKVLEDPAASGVDFTKMGYLFFTANPEKESETFNGFLVSLKDAKKLEALVKTEGDVNAKSSFKYVLGEDDKIVAWTDEVALFGNSNDFINLVDEAGKIFQTKAAESVAENKDLQKAFAESHDLSLWFNSNPLAGSSELQMGTSMAEIDPEALKDNYVHGYMDFLDGRIEGTANLFLQKKLTKDFDKLFNDKVSSDFSKYVPGDHLAMLLTGAVNIRGIDEVLSARSQSKGFLEFSLKEYGLTTKDIRETFGGDIVFAAVGQEESDKKVGMFATNILDQKKLQLFLDLGVARDMLEKERDNQYQVKQVNLGKENAFFHITMDDGAPRLLVKDGLLFVCSDEHWMYYLENGGFPKEERLKGELLDKSAGHLFSLYFDANGLKSVDKSVGDYSMKDFQLQAGRDQVNLLIRMNDEKTNALKALFEGAAKQYEAEKKEVQ